MDIKILSSEDVFVNKRKIKAFVYESVKMSAYEASYSYDEAEQKVKELQTYIEQDSAIALGAFGDKGMTGFLWAYKYPYREDTNRLYISILHVSEEYRNMEIGTELIRKIESIAKEKGIDGVYLHAEATNNGACKFYEKMGFKRERIQFVKKYTGR
ncbi:GNAT family N-acetyltransferase [Schaedlerella arabinosiphila]|uniref:GNAT family N-acetyltransferase n=1 Tax=Schaedlerella arabinosiphila TaxID=2044587 RepID=A0A9X5H442_9FIRM|nr:GNAT family N-acetyltransferase [Schaedlerella arabinosiphila]KAI4443525.1 hypothetical protein C824_006061 [Schaedlerella arabinosiphila]NDO68167.1 GNAT family N-acetyltransferase [Schaedlerella arabinosiphila]